MKKEIHIFARGIEPEALSQFESAMTQEFSVKGALMPDAHVGYTLPIGGVVATDGVILPSWVGYDIGCGMCAVKTDFQPLQIGQHSNRIFQEIYQSIPTGFKHNKKNGPWRYRHLECTSTLERIFDKNGLKQLCSLGSGNHFIEIGTDEENKVWIVVHSGSRGIGHAVASYYMRVASGDGKPREGHYGFEVDSKNGRDYIKDMNFCLAFALENRRRIIERVFNIVRGIIGEKPRPSFDTTGMINRNHNHAELHEGLWIHRKGATQAEKGMLGVVPGNMRDGSFIVEGLGNPDSLWSSSHGAGRVLGRRRAKKQLSLDDFKGTMQGIKAKVTHSTIDESPFAYKDIYEVMALQNSLIKTLNHIKPIINIKA
ncbi:MAG: RtcB family protein [Proteobacteria bacterium]|nr:RtcB family protein [Pseudomonadota bacterium]